MAKTNLIFLLAMASCLSLGQAAAGREAGKAGKTSFKVVLVTLDGVRWQDLFRGPDTALVADAKRTEKRAEIEKIFVRQPERAKAVTPFLHSIVASGGVLVGDRDHGSCDKVLNPYWFSYPGYNEILTGRVDPRVNSNDATPNPDMTVLGWLSDQPGFRNRVQVYGTWGVFHAILARHPGLLPVNAGVEPVGAADPQMQAVDALQAEVDHPWSLDERFDAFTNTYAMRALLRDHPRVLYVADGETDSQAHAGKYDEYLIALNRSDRFIAKLWVTLQRDPYYAGQTTLIVTTDHGRGRQTQGETDKWTDHGSGLDEQGQAHPESHVGGSDETWAAVLGPKALGAVRRNGSCATNGQVASTLLQALGLDWRTYSPQIAPPLFTAP